MKGLKELALSCLLFVISTCSYATEISSQVQKMEPYAYHGFEFLEYNSNGWVSTYHSDDIYWSIAIRPELRGDDAPKFVPSFLGGHAGRALELGGEDRLQIDLSFLYYSLSWGEAPVVIGLFMQPSADTLGPQQCLFSIGDRLALFNGAQMLVYEDGEEGERVNEYASFSGGPIFLTFEDDAIKVRVGDDDIWTHSVSDWNDIVGAGLQFGGCSDAAAEKFASGSQGFKGAIDELIVLTPRALDALAPLSLERAEVDAERETGGQEEGDWEGVEEPEFATAEMLRQIIFLAGHATYPLKGSWLSDEVFEFYNADSFDVFLASSVDCCVDASLGSHEVQNYYAHGNIGVHGLYTIADMEWWPGSNISVPSPSVMNFRCMGDSDEGCQRSASHLRRGLAFGRPLGMESAEFSLLRENLRASLSARPKSLTFEFNQRLRASQELPSRVSFFRSNGTGWDVVNPQSVSGYQSTLTVEFSEPLQDGEYRVEFSSSLESIFGELLGVDESFDFSVVAEEVIVNSDTHLWSEHDGKHLVVDGARVSLSGYRDFASVKVINGGVIHTAGSTTLTVSADRVEVSTDSVIDLSGVGGSHDTSVGLYSGGSYGGQGGYYQNNAVKPVYGAFDLPTTAGTGGRGTGSTYSRGGGTLRIRTDELVLNGVLAVNGEARDYVGAGSGGSILLEVGSVQVGEQAKITANGGISGCCGYSGGGGGRIAIHYGDGQGAALRQVASAKGSLGRSSYRHGAAGTIYLNDSSNAQVELIVDNSGVDKANAAITPLDFGVDGKFAGKLTLVNANVALAAAELAEVVATDSAVSLAVAQIDSVTSSNSSIVQTEDLQLGTMQLAGGIWKQGGKSLDVGTYQVIDGEHEATGAFNVLGSSELVVDGYTLALGQPGTWTKVSVINQGKITTAESTMQLQINAQEIFVDSASSIDLTGKGPLGDATLQLREGGSHGGRGAYYTDGSGRTFGYFREPTMPGGGGRGYYAQITSQGGGALRLTVDLLRLDGRLLTNGAISDTANHAAGAGGSLWLQAASIELGEQARIEARGGDATAGSQVGAGGGGRIAVEYEHVDETALVRSLTARGGNSRSSVAVDGSAGTLFLRHLSSSQEKLIVDNTGVNRPLSLVTPVDLGSGGFAGLIKVRNANVELVGGHVAQLQSESSTLALELASVDSIDSMDSSITQTSDLGVETLQARGGIWSMGGHALDADDYSFVGGTLDMRGAFSGATEELIVDGYTLVLNADGNWQRVRVVNNGVLTTAPASDLLTKQVVVTADEIEVDATSRIDISAKGLPGSGVVTSYCGGSYGGRGGAWSGCSPNETYGNYLEPTDFGAGGSLNRGGGAIKLSSRTLALHGKLVADGGLVNAVPSGGGSGGSIWIDTQMLTGGQSTQITANGGGRGNYYYGSPGGGGRIAIYYTGIDGINLQTQVTAAPAAPWSGYSAEAGSVHLQNRAIPTAVARTDLAVAESRQIASFTIDFINEVDPETLNSNTIKLISGGVEQTIISIVEVSPVRFLVNLPTPLADAAYTLTVGPGIRTLAGRGMDQNGNGIEDEPTDAYVFSFVVDHAPPAAPQITAPLVAPAINSGNKRTVVLTGNRTEPSAILVNGLIKVAHGEGVWSIPGQAVEEGSSELRIQAQDLAGNLSEPVRLLFNVDSIRPAILERSPSQSYLNQAPESLWVRFREEGSGLDAAASSLTLKLGDVVIPGQLSLEGDTLRLTPSVPLLEGSYRWEIRLRDNAGNETLSAPTLVMDYTAPAAPLVEEYPAVTAQRTLQLRVLNREGGNTVIVRNAAGAYVSQWGVTVNLTLADGDNLFTLEQVDSAGNVSPLTEIRIRFDNQAPGPVGIQLNPEGSGTEVEISWPDYDVVANGNDIASYRVYGSSQPFTSTAQAQLLRTLSSYHTRSYRATGLARGVPHHFAVVAVDQAGQALDAVVSSAAVPKDIQAPEEVASLTVRPAATSLALSWQPSPNTADDLSGYVLYVGATDPQRIELPLAGALTHTVSGLAAASSTPLRLVAIDNDGNESAGRTDPGVTWLENPVSLTLEAQSNRALATWNAAQPAELVSGYRIYVANAPFSSVTGMQPRMTRDASTVETLIGGLLNDRTYHIAVTAVNTSAGENPQVQSVSVTPATDTAGPELQSLGWLSAAGLQPLENGTELRELGEWRLAASDESGIGRVELSLNGTPLGQMQLQGNLYRYVWDLASVEDGEHQLGVRMVDTLGTATELTFPLRVALQAPGKPTLELSTKADRTNEPEQRITVQGLPRAVVRLLHNGAASADEITLDFNGRAEWPITLRDGENRFAASQRHASRAQFGPVSDEVSVVLDSTLPDAPPGLQATARAMGVVQLSWTAPKTVVGYNLYASLQPFDSLNAAGVSKLNTQPLTSPSYQHEASEEGTYHYRVTSLNALGSESLPSQMRSAVADKTSPRVEQIQYNSLGVVAADGRHAPARIDMRVRVSEPLRNAPFLSLDVAQGMSIPVRLTQAANDPLAYVGGFDLTENVPSGLLYARVSAHDKVGNEGTEVLEGNTLRVDTRGPEVIQLALLPGHPIQNQVVDNQGSELQVILRLSEDPVAAPRLVPLLDGAAWSGQSSPLELSLDGQSQPGAPLYTGRFRLPANAGANSVQLLGFDYQASDDLDNQSQRIQGRREFQVYQGDLPPLDIPQGLSGKALAGGRVALTWRSVDEADAYEVYRRADADASFSSIGRVRELEFADDLPAAGLADGRYHYRVASIRQDNEQEALSLPSEAVAVDVVSAAPQAPRELTAELTGSGIVVRWLAPEQGQIASYNLYRVNAAEGALVDISGLEPIRSGLTDRVALDNRPSDTDHAYTVTALDAAGNESAPAVSVYLNAGLLPVRDLAIVREEGQPARLRWEHNGRDVVGYNVYEGADDTRRKLNAELLGERFYVDAGGVSGEKLYSVTAVDSHGVESLPHSLLLPQLKIEARPEQRFERGIFNRLHYRISNLGGQELKRLRLRIGVSLDGVVQWQQSDAFDVAPGALAEVPVVVAGHAQLPGVVPLLLEIQHVPQPGEEVLLQSADSILAGENSMVAQLLGENLTRGGEGQLRLRLENPSEVPVELVTARSNGKLASDELRLVLEDLQGNVLSTAPVHMALGDGVVTLRDGRTVARVGAQDVLEIGPLSIPVPEAAPEEVRVRFTADRQYYQAALPGELKIGGLRASRELTLLDTPYYGELTSIEPQQIQAGDSVLISGKALLRDGQQPVPGAELSLVLSVRGFEQIISVTADAEGNFSRRYTSAATDSGRYHISVLHPQIQSRPVHGTFDILGASASPEVFKASFPRNYEQAFAITVEAGHDSPLRNVRLQYQQPEGSTGLPAGIQVRQSAPLNLAAKQKGTLTLHISGSNSAAVSGLLDYQVVADDLSRPVGKTRIHYNLVEALPRAMVEPRQLSTGMAREAEQVESIRLSSTGLEALRNLRLTLLDEQGAAAPDWVNLRIRAQHPELAVGANLPIEVAFTPGATVAEGDHYFTLRIESDNHPVVDVPMRAAVTQSGKGGVVFQVENIYTGTLDEQGQRVLGLKGARVKLQNRAVLSAEYAGVTNEQGQLLLEELPAGEYSYRISAWDHEDIAGQFWIKPGVVRDERVFLMSKLVTVEWSVKEITLEDRYDIILNATFKTAVPTALVMIEPLSINLPVMRKGDVMQGELTLTNYGLIRADNVRGDLPSGDARVKIEYLRPVPDKLEAGDVVVIPYRIVALQSFDPDDELNGPAGCWNINYSGIVRYESQCINGQVIPGAASVSWTYVNRGCSRPVGGGSSVSGPYQPWGTGGGGGYSGFTRGTGFGDVKACAPDPSGDSCDALGGGFGGAGSGALTGAQ